MKHKNKLRLWSFIMTICILLSASHFSITTVAAENDQQFVNYEVGEFDSQAEVLSTTTPSISLDYSQFEIFVGNTRKLNATTNPAGQTVSWQSSDNSIATVSSGGLVTAKSVGTTTILAMFMTSDRNMYVAQCTVHVRLAEGEYFLQNEQTGYYADIKGPTMASGTTIHQWRFNLNKSQKWYFKYLGSGYYSIKSMNLPDSPTSYYLGVINDSSGLDVDIVLRTGPLTNGMKWKIEPTSNGALKLIPKTGESKGYVLATTTSSATNGAKLIQGAYVDNDSYRDEWSIHKTSEYAYITNYANIYYDSEQFISESNLKMKYETAVADFLTKYNVAFKVNSVSHSSLLDFNSSSCAEGLYKICSDSCATLSSCNTSHHKGGQRLLNLLTSNSYYNCRLVEYTLCRYDEGTHKQIAGLANTPGRNTIVSTYFYNIEETIQHELSHNLGADHDTCSKKDCILAEDVLDKWCSACETAIKNTIKGN